MAGSTLELTQPDYEAEIGFYLGYGRSSGDWSSDQSTEIAAVLKAAERQFYFPDMVPGVPSHEWTFLKPVADLTIWPDQTLTMSGTGSYDAGTDETTLTFSAGTAYSTMTSRSLTFTTSSTEYTVSEFVSSTSLKVTGDASSETSGDTVTVTDVGDYDLPDAFGRLDGPVQYATETGVVNIRQTNWSVILTARQRSSGTAGHPTICGVRPKAIDATVGQRYEILFYPQPDSIYALKLRYAVLPDAMTAGNLYALGGAEHTETLLASCMDQAQRRLNDSIADKQIDYKNKLMASIQRDLRHGAEHSGQMRDRSDDVYEHTGHSGAYYNDRVIGGQVTYEGVSY